MTPNPSERRLGLSWALTSAVGVALMVIPWKLANEAGDPSHSVLVLLGVAAVSNTALVIGQRVASGHLRFQVSATDLGVSVLLALFTLFGNLASAIAVQDLSPTLLNVLLRVDVLFVAIFGWLLLGERVERRFWLGAFIAWVGLVILQGPVAEGSIPGLAAAGTGMAIAAAACFSALTIVTRRFIHRIDLVAVNAMRLWLSVALWFPVHGLPRIDEMPGDQILYASLAALAGPFFARLALMISSRYIEARLTTLATLAAPVMTLFLAFVLLSDWPLPHELVGGAIMIAGISIPVLRRT